MQSSQEHTLTAPTKGSSGLGAGLFLLITAVATLVAVITRVSANADQPTLAETLTVISENKALYASGGGARFVSGVTLIVAAWFLSKTGAGEKQPSARIAPLIFALSGLFTGISGASAIALTNAAPAPPRRPPRDHSLRPIAHRQDRLHPSWSGPLTGGTSAVEFRTTLQVPCPRLGCHRHCHAIYLVGRRHHGSPNHRYRLPLLAYRRRRITA